MAQDTMTLNVEGVIVSFPYHTPHPQQLEIMSQTMKALQQVGQYRRERCTINIVCRDSGVGRCELLSVTGNIRFLAWLPVTVQYFFLYYLR